MYTRILVAIDGSKIAEKALLAAIDLAKISNADLHVLNVVQPVISGSMAGTATYKIDSVFTLQKSEQEEMLKNAEELCKKSGLEVKLHSVVGEPKTEILMLAKEIEADLIVMGTKGKSNLDKVFIGSVSNSVLHTSKISTLIIK